MKEIVIFTDLDGTLLSVTNYSFEPAIEAISELKKRNIPLIICSSKTRAEIQFYRKKLENHHPFVSENGGGIFIEKGYFNETELPLSYEKIDEFLLIKLGAEYNKLRLALNKLKQKGYKIKGFGDMSIEELSKLTGLSKQEALLAKQREFDEPFIFEDKKTENIS